MKLSQGIGMLEISINLTGNQSKIYPNILTNEEAQRALKSLKKLTNFDIENIVCYHEGLYNNIPTMPLKSFWRRLND